MESWAMVRASSPYMKMARRKKAPTRVATGERRAAARRERDRVETASRKERDRVETASRKARGLGVVAAEGAGGSREGLPMALAGAGAWYCGGVSVAPGPANQARPRPNPPTGRRTRLLVFVGLQGRRDCADQTSVIQVNARLVKLIVPFPDLKKSNSVLFTVNVGAG
jgi:hypothetical protein